MLSDGKCSVTKASLITAGIAADPARSMKLLAFGITCVQELPGCVAQKGKAAALQQGQQCHNYTHDQ